MDMLNHWIDGKPLQKRVDRFGEVYDPATGQVTCHVPFADDEVVDSAVTSAKEAYSSWRRLSLSRRAHVLFAFRELVSNHLDELARIIASEHGKVLSDARGEAERGLEVIDFACGVPHLLKGGFSQNVSTAVDSYSIRQPIGVVAGITPFNFPVMVPMWMHPVAIACGNTFVLKPSERDPSASNLVAELWTRAGLPDGVFNVVHGDRVAVERLLEHRDVAAISFVGSTPVARSIYRTGTQQDKRVQALGGAKNHMVVLPDADVGSAADAAASAAYGSAGERCMAISTLVAVGSAADPLVEALSDRARAITVGPGLDGRYDMGPLVSAAHRDRVAGYVKTGVAEGADLVVDGRDLAVDGHDDGFWLGPCLFDRVTPEMTIYREEIFGPVLIVLRVNTAAEAIELVNRNPYGNGTAIFTNDGGAARQYEEDIEVGMVGINVPIPVPMAYYSFGGWKDSLFGDSHVHGPEGVHFYTRGKVVTRRWHDPTERHGIDLGFPTNR